MIVGTEAMWYVVGIGMCITVVSGIVAGICDECKSKEGTAIFGAISLVGFGLAGVSVLKWFLGNLFEGRFF